MSQETYGQYITITKQAIRVKCVRCSHLWNYTGSKNFATCPSCHTTIGIAKLIKKLKSVNESRIDPQTSLTESTGVNQ
jgi:hypothetical protein